MRLLHEKSPESRRLTAAIRGPPVAAARDRIAQRRPEGWSSARPTGVLGGHLAGGREWPYEPAPSMREVEARALGLGNSAMFESDGRVEALLELGRPRSGEDAGAWRRGAAELLRRHEEPAACHHTRLGGAVSATVGWLTDTGWHVWHADGPPCRAPFDPAPAPRSRGWTSARPRPTC